MEYTRIKEWKDNITGYQTSLVLYRAVRNGIPYEERSPGKWELHNKTYYCSECGEEAIDLESEPDVYGSSYCLTDYCPYCGADMRGNKREPSDYLKERLKDPEFRKVWEKWCSEDIQKDGEEE